MSAGKAKNKGYIWNGRPVKVKDSFCHRVAFPVLPGSGTTNQGVYE